MTHATIHRSFNPGRSPLFGVAAVFATAATMGIAVLLPSLSTATRAPAAAVAAAPQSTDAQAPLRFVTLPAVEVVGLRETKSAANRWTAPAAFKKKS
jgi:hypothetical protein